MRKICRKIEYIILKPTPYDDFKGSGASCCSERNTFTRHSEQSEESQSAFDSCHPELDSGSQGRSHCILLHLPLRFRLCGRNDESTFPSPRGRVPEGQEGVLCQIKPHPNFKFSSKALNRKFYPPRKPFVSLTFRGGKRTFFSLSKGEGWGEGSSRRISKSFALYLASFIPRGGELWLA